MSSGRRKKKKPTPKKTGKKKRTEVEDEADDDHGEDPPEESPEAAGGGEDDGASPPKEETKPKKKKKKLTAKEKRAAAKKAKADAAAAKKAKRPRFGSLFGSAKKKKKVTKKKKGAESERDDDDDEHAEEAAEALPYIQFDIVVKQKGTIGLSLIFCPDDDDGNVIIDEDPMNNRVLVTGVNSKGGLRQSDGNEQIPEYDPDTKLPVGGEQEQDELFAVDDVEMRARSSTFVKGSLGGRPVKLTFRREKPQMEIELSGDGGFEFGADFLLSLDGVDGGVEKKNLEANAAAAKAGDALQAAVQFAEAQATEAAGAAKLAAMLVAREKAAKAAAVFDMQCMLIEDSRTGQRQLTVSHTRDFHIGAKFVVNSGEPNAERGAIVFLEKGPPEILVIDVTLRWKHKKGEPVEIHVPAFDAPNSAAPGVAEKPQVVVPERGARGGRTSAADRAKVNELVIDALKMESMSEAMVLQIKQLFDKGTLSALAAEEELDKMMIEALTARRSSKSEAPLPRSYAARVEADAQLRRAERETAAAAASAQQHYVSSAPAFDFRARMSAGEIKMTSSMSAANVKIRTSSTSARPGYDTSYARSGPAGPVGGAATRRAQGHLGLMCDVLTDFFAARPSEPEEVLRRRRGGERGATKTPFGLVVGCARLEIEGAEIERVLLTNHVTNHVLEEARFRSAYQPGYQLILARTSPLRDDASTVLGIDSALALRCAKAGIAVFAMGDALDHVSGGVNDWICASLGHGTEVPLLASEADRAHLEPRGRGRLLTLDRTERVSELLERLQRPGGLSRIQMAPSAEFYAVSDVVMDGGEIMDAAYSRAREQRVRTVAVACGCSADELAGHTWGDVDVLVASRLPMTSVLSLTERNVTVVIVGSCVGKKFLHFLHSQLSGLLNRTKELKGVKLSVSQCTTALSPFLTV